MQPFTFASNVDDYPRHSDRGTRSRLRRATSVACVPRDRLRPVALQKLHGSPGNPPGELLVWRAPRVTSQEEETIVAPRKSLGQRLPRREPRWNDLFGIHLYLPSVMDTNGDVSPGFRHVCRGW